MARMEGRKEKKRRKEKREIHQKKIEDYLYMLLYMEGIL